VEPCTRDAAGGRFGSSFGDDAIEVYQEGS
jgi:hypothetical protein